LPFGFPLLLGRAAAGTVFRDKPDPVFVQDFGEGIGGHGPIVIPNEIRTSGAHYDQIPARDPFGSMTWR
jgi:hypothetical protein